MAEAVDDIELDNLDHEREAENNEEEESSFIDNRPEDESILIINTSNPVFTRPDDESIPNPRRDAGVIRRHIIHDKKQFLKTGLGITVNKGDGPNSTILYDELKTVTGKNGKINGATYKGKKILFLKNGKMEYSADKSKTQYVNEFKELLKKAYAEHQKTPAALVEKHVGVDIPQYVMNDITSNVSDRIETEISDILSDLRNNVELTENELREFRGILDVKKDSGEEKIKALEVEIKHWKTKSQEEGNEMKSKLYEAFAKTAELKADEIRLNLNQKPQNEEVISMVKEEADVNDLTRFERFKKWARENVAGLSAVAISIAGILTTVIMTGRNALKRGGQGVSKFGKAVANLAKKFGPVLAALGNLIAKILMLGAKGISWLSQNLWILALALTYFVYNEYRRKK